jgi:hypothetical protein
MGITTDLNRGETGIHTDHVVSDPLVGARWPVLALLHPHARMRLLLFGLALGMIGWGMAIWQAGMPIWGATTLALALLLGPIALKWRDDWRSYGLVVMVLSVVLVLQGFHTIEHIVQAAQFYLFHWSPFRSSGLISSLNAEWVHFTWNWLVVGVMIYLMRQGMRNRWVWLLLVWAVAHSLEHTYLLVRYLQVREALLQFGLSDLAVAQALPGILGRDGLLAQGFACRIPGVTTASRLAVHFWWNVGEFTLLLLAANCFLHHRFQSLVNLRR